MFNIEFLHLIREYEYKEIVGRLSPGIRILEIGGGTGYQAKRMTEDGFVVDSIDIPGTNYAGQLEFPVQSYDGRNIPFPNGSFDIVFSSNVLEHVRDLPYLQAEIKRVLKSSGYCIHLMPTGAWRLWTIFTHYLEFVQILSGLTPRLIPRGFSRHSLVDALNVLRLIASTSKRYLIVPRHGETGNALSEVIAFSLHYWKKQFLKEGFILKEVAPAGLFYTGHMVLGLKLSLKARQKLAKWLGSACAIYVVHSA